MTLFQKAFAKINIIGIGLFFLDRWLKTLALRYLVEGFLFYPNFLGGVGFKLTTNKNIAFSFPASGKALLLFIAIVIIFLFFLLIKEYKKNNFNFWLVFALTLIIGGALSNLFDRLLWGAVIDYAIIFIWPVFNLADVMITCGTGLWIFVCFLPCKRASFAKT